MCTINYLAFISQTKWVDLRVWGQENTVCWRIRRRLGHGWGFHIISVKCFYLTAVTVLDKLMSAEVFVVYYEIILQTRALELDQSYIFECLKVAGRASITHRHSEGQCKEHSLVLALSVFNHVWQAAERLTGLLIGYVVYYTYSLVRKPHKASVYLIKPSFCLDSI